jgi:hypothetical protein
VLPASIIRKMTHSLANVGSKHLWNTGKFLPDYMVQQPEDSHFHQLVFVFARLPCNVCTLKDEITLNTLGNVAMLSTTPKCRPDIRHALCNMDLHHKQQELNQNWWPMTRIKYLHSFVINRILIFYFSYLLSCNITINFSKMSANVTVVMVVILVTTAIILVHTVVLLS